MDVPDRVFRRPNCPSFLQGELPTLTLAAVGTVVSAGARHEEPRVLLDVDTGSHDPLVDVLKVFGRLGRDGVDTLGGEGREGRGEDGRGGEGYGGGR